MHGLDVMQHSVDSMSALITYGFLHGIILKTMKLLLKVWYNPLLIPSIHAYKIFKILKAIFIQRRERRKTYPDPKKHCHYVNLSYVDKLMLWFKQADAIDDVIGSLHNKC